MSHRRIFRTGRHKVQLAATAAAIVLFSQPAFAIDVATETELRAAIETARTTPGTQIVLTANIALTQDLPALQGIDTVVRSSTSNAFSINGSGQFRGLFVYSGSTTVQDLTITNAVARGGNGGNGDVGAGGGGGGMGGALFVNAGATVTVANVSLTGNAASGGTGGNMGSGSGVSGGGGGLGGDGGNGNDPNWAGGGGIGRGATGGSGGGPGAAGIVTGAPGGGAGAGLGATAGGLSGGGGGQGWAGGGGGGVGGGDSGDVYGGFGGFGGGGGGGSSGSLGGVGGFGGGAGGVAARGGFGGGGGTYSAGGFGGGTGGLFAFGGAGGGAGMGGAIFVVEGGTLNLQGSLSIDGNTVAGGAGGTGATAGSAFGSGLFLQGNGTLTFDPGAMQTQTIGNVIADQSGSIPGAPNFATGGPTCTIGVGCAGYSGAGSWALSKTGAGTVVLNGNNTYTGATDINAGALLVNGSIANSSLTTVRNGGTLGGDGIVGNTVIAAGGTLSPGNSIGRLDVNGNLTFQPGATYLVELDPTDADRTDVTGTAALAGTVNAVFAPGSYVTRQYTILSAQGGVTGTFGPLQTTNLPVSFQAMLDYQGNEVWLQLTAKLGSGAGPLSANQQNVAQAINTFFNAGGALPPGFVSMFGLTGDALRNALNQTSGESGASVSTSTFMAWNSFFNMIFDPFAQNRGGFGGGGANAFAPTANVQSEEVRLAYAAVTPKRDLKDASVTKAAALADPFTSRWSVWGGGYGGSATTDGNAQTGSHDTTSRAYGFAVGADHRPAPDTIIGFALAGGGTSFGLTQGLGGGTSDLFQASVYARQHWGAAYLMTAFGFGWQDFTLNRTVGIAGTDKLEADFNAYTLAGRAEGGWRFGSAFAGMTPYAAVQVVSLDLPSYTERATSGANTFALSYAGRTDTQTRSELGARLDYAMPVQDALLTLRGRAAWAHDYDTDRIANPAFLTLPGAAFTVGGATPDANVLLVSAGAELAMRNGVSLAGSFEGEFSGNTQSYAGKGAIRYRW